MLKSALHWLKGTRPGQITFEDIKSWVGKEDAVILEIGANDGTDTKRFAETFPQARIFAFEPDPRAAERWQTQVQSPNVTLVQTAIGNSNGTVTFHQSDGDVQDGPQTGWDLSGSIRAPKDHLKRHPHINFDQTLDVPISTLDRWAEDNNIGEIDFIWADVQGAENDLILGAQKTLSRTRLFYTEYDNREMYEGQWSLQTISENLKDHTLIARWKNDALFQLKSAGKR
ncbi:MAG: FkbM family methyltransferase [Pseudomonadota bacterium]